MKNKDRKTIVAEDNELMKTAINPNQTGKEKPLNLLKYALIIFKALSFSKN